MKRIIYLAVVLLAVTFVLRLRERSRADAVAPVAETAPVQPAAAVHRSGDAAPKAVPTGAPARVPSGAPDPEVTASLANDPIEPEKPQTPEWKLEKTVHLQELLSRHLERLEKERAAAHAAGNTGEEYRLHVSIARGRARLEHLQGEAALLRQELAH